ncbi:hypothetical protein E2562_012958 [Oryza meyeriana var. granulata]|uniref:Uncharacterized protein n=1 Tax=Oryza meyeriana var. granulata TaxID=110450 RepID=A0A6G1DIL4_9ORYZ|nr:hypothetical protein E2562_012958 [Oryza meyeriana var. granulata]
MAKLAVVATLILAAVMAATTMPSSRGIRLLEGSAADEFTVVPPTATAGAPLSLMWIVMPLRDLDGGTLSEEVGAGPAPAPAETYREGDLENKVPVLGP